MAGHEDDIKNIPEDRAVQHILVLGFHHKKGCQVEFSYPPLIPGGDSKCPELPSSWRDLPSLALPDGSHNFTSDTVYFHLPARDNPRQSVFGISCYRQIDMEKVVNKTEDMTRGTVQKSVCVISRLPLYGQIQVKMSLITHAYFEGGDFSDTELIKQTYDNLNNSLCNDMLHNQQLYVGLSARDFILHHKQKALLLFKLVLLERKVLFFKSPVQELSRHILTLLSLFPGLLESGMFEAACPAPSNNSLKVTQDLMVRDGCKDSGCGDRRSVFSVTPRPPSCILKSKSLTNLSSKLKGAMSHSVARKSSSNGDINGFTSYLSEEMYAEDLKTAPDYATVASCSSEDLGLPLKIFTAGNLCHPYLSLPYLDTLMRDGTRGHLTGATNAMFKAKKGLSDVIIDIDEDKLDILNPDLRKDLSLTIEDLRFIDGILRVVENKGGVGWEGGDEWIRSQFKFYLACLLRSSLQDPGCSSYDHFNRGFMTSFLQTRHYSHWCPPLALTTLAPGHPCGGGHLSMADIRLRFNNTECGKRASLAMQSTGRVVADTGKSLQSWFSG